MPAKNPPHMKKPLVNNTAEATTDTDRRAFMAGAAGAGAALAGLAAASPAHAADMAMQKDMKGKTAFVTGAARGIGLSCADALAARGANIVILDVADQIAEVPYPLATAADLASAKTQIESHGVSCIALAGDVRDMAAQENAVNAAVDKFGGLDFVIPNAGNTQTGFLEELSEAEIDLVLDINLKALPSSFICCRKGFMGLNMSVLSPPFYVLTGLLLFQEMCLILPPGSMPAFRLNWFVLRTLKV